MIMNILMLFIISTFAYTQDDDSKIDTSYVSNLNKIARELILKDNQKAKELLDSAFNYAYKNTSHYWIAYTYQSFGLFHLKNDSLVRATDYLELSARAFTDIKLYNDKAFTNIMLSDIYYSIGRNQKSIDALKKSLKDEEKLYNEYIHSIYLKLAENYEKLEDTSNSLFYRQLFNPQVETLDFKIELDDNIAEALKEQSHVHELEMELEIEKLKSEYIIWIFSSLIIILFLITFVLTIKLYKVKKRLAQKVNQK